MLQERKKLLKARFSHLEKQIANLQKESLTQLRARLAEVISKPFVRRNAKFHVFLLYLRKCPETLQFYPVIHWVCDMLQHFRYLYNVVFDH